MSQEVELREVRSEVEGLTYRALLVLMKQDLPQLPHYVRFGLAAEEMKTRKLYREGGYKTWGIFCEHELGLTQQRVGQLIRSSRLALQVSADERPRNERQARKQLEDMKPKTAPEASHRAESAKTVSFSEASEMSEPSPRGPLDPVEQLWRAVMACREAGVAKSRIYQIIESCYRQEEAHQARKFKGPITREATGGRSVAARKDMEKHRQ